VVCRSNHKIRRLDIRCLQDGSCTIVITWIRYDVAVNEDGELGVGDKLGWCYVVNF